jgi:hypothetical protein
MSLLVRKIEKGRWLQNDIRNGAEVSADAITNCTRTKGNALSVWEISGRDQVDDAVIAMVSQCDSLETIDVVLLGRTNLIEKGLEIKQTPGTTALSDFGDKHHDIAGMTYRTLGILAALIVSEFRTDQVIRYTRGQIERLLKEAVGNGRIQTDLLRAGVRSKICPSI